MKALSLDLRERIVKAFDSGEGTRAQVAKRFDVSDAMVKKLLRQRRRTGEIGPQFHRCKGVKPKIGPEDLERLRQMVEDQPDLTLRELHEALGVACTIATVHNALKRIGMTYKKRVSKPASSSDRTS